MNRGILARLKDGLLTKVKYARENKLRFVLKKTGKSLNDYALGEFIVVGGRKTSGKSSFILKNYIIEPMLQKLELKQDLGLKLLYINTKKTYRETLE